MTQAIEKESNKLADVKWTPTGKLEIAFVDKMTRVFDPSTVHSALHLDAERYGWAVRFQRLGAISATEFPSRGERIAEYKRRVDERIAHLLTGADTWEVPRKAAAPRVTRDDVEEAILRAYPQSNPTKVFSGKLAEISAKGTAPEADNVAATVRYWLATRQVASAWAEIQAERRAANAQALLDADAEVDRLMAGE